MTPFTALTSIILPLREDRIDTDILFPARFLLLMDRDGLGEYFCRDRRVDAAGTPIPGNPIDDPRYADARIVIGGEDFGCGSSREQAVWALAGFGIRCVIAPSFGEIFAANCLRNGVLTVALPRDRIDQLGPEVTVSLEEQTLTAGAVTLPFAVPDATRTRLLNGWDDIDLILQAEGENVARFEQIQRYQQPWLYETPA